MSKYLPLILTLAGTLGAAILTPTFLAAHVQVFAVVGAVAQVLHAALPSIFGSPSASN
jgi:hypothetical protein